MTYTAFTPARAPGRAVFNAGAVAFHGLTDDTLSRAAATLGDPVTAERLRARAAATYRRVGATWWLHRLQAWRPGPATRPASGAQRFTLHATAKGLWLIGSPHNAVPMRELRGFIHLRELLRRPGVPVSALDLVTGGAPTVVQPGFGETLDRRAVADYRRRLNDIDQETAEAAEWADLGRLDRLQTEWNAVLAELANGTGLGGRQRNTGSTHERARVAAIKAIATAINRIAAVDPSLGKHLRATVRTGGECVYSPHSTDAPEWILS